MKTPITIPAIGESISEVVIGAILKPSGSYVEQDTEILEIETDKLNQVIYAPSSGLLTLVVTTGEKIAVGQSIGHIEEATKPESAAPVVQKEPPAVVVAAVRAGERRQPMSTIRKTIAERLVQAQKQTASVTTFQEADMSEVMKLREQYKEAFFKKYGVRLGLMSFFVKAAASALQAFGQVNAYIQGDEIVFHDQIDISVAVSTERGLVVPVLRNCEHLSFADIERQIEDFASRAKEEKLKMQELQGGGFTITNGGVFGSMLSTPLLNPPQCAILGMHKILKRAVVVNDEICIRPMMYLALTYDHRLIDGKEGVSFLMHIKNCIEDPHRLELGV